MNILLSTLLVLGAIQSCDGLKFTIPIYNYHEWSVINNAFKDIIGPLHHDISTNNISPRVAGEQFSLLLGKFLESHPEFVAHEASDKYQQHEPNTLVKARKIKNALRKKAFSSTGSEEERKAFHDALKTVGFLKKQQTRSINTKTAAHQERLYHANFWKFAGNAANGKLDTNNLKPTFDLETANSYYPGKYAVNSPIDMTKHTSALKETV